MQIQLKQTEIIAALKQYITSQGINLVGKEVTISFTAGRKESGVTADLVIEDTGIPGFDEAAEETAKPVLAVVPVTPIVKAVEQTAAAVEEPTVTVHESVVKTPTSLFN